MIRNTLVIVSLMMLFSVKTWSQEITGDKIIKNLYMSENYGTIKDMITELDCFGPAMKKQEATDLMELFFTAKVFFYAPNKIRTEKTMVDPQAQSDLSVLTIRDGIIETAHIGNQMISKKEDDHHHSLFLPFGIDIQPQDQYRNYTLVSAEQFSDRDVYVINITNEQDPEAKILTVWIDRERFIPLKEEYRVTEGEKETVKTTLYKNPWQLKDGRWMPLRIEKYENGKMTCYIILKETSINDGLDEDLFIP